MVNSGDGATGKKKCMPALDDYYECLHHRKEVRAIPVRLRMLQTCNGGFVSNDENSTQALRTMKMQAAYRKAEAAHPRENAPKAEQIRSLGLLGKGEEAATVLSQR